MRRFILIVMMVLLPLQWSWAAAASVCEHESGQTHFGHHNHEHAGEVEDGEAEPQVEKAKTADYHPDCHSCHAMGAACLEQAGDSQPAWAEDVLRTEYVRFLAEPPVESFLRPPLHLVA